MTNLVDILNNIGYTKLTDYGRQYSTRPLYRDSDNNTALTINKDTGEWFDFVDRVGGPLETLIERTLGRPLTPELKEKISSNEFLPLRRTEIDLPFQKVFEKSKLVKLVKDHDYWIKRGVSNSTISKFEGGIAIDGRMRNRYVFPIFNERNELVGFSGRYIYKSPYVVKWKHIGAKSNWIFPLIHSQEILKQKKVILVESIGDMLSLHDAGIKNVLVTFGVTLSGAVVKHLLKMDLEKIFIALNNDSLNNSVGNKAAETFKGGLSNYFDSEQIQISLPSKNDFGVMNRDEINLWKQNNQI